MKMIRIKHIILSFMIMTFVSCQDFLDPESISTFDQNYIFSNAEDARKAMNAAYVHFSHDGFRSRLSNNMTGCTDIEHAGGSSDGARYQIWRLDARENNGDLEYVWEIGYQAIRDCNIAIEGIQNSEAFGSDDVALADEMNHLLGEAYTLRAYWYSMLTFYFGDVPFSTHAPGVDVEFNLPKVDRNEILSQLIQDMIDIEEDMKWAEDCQFGIEQINREYTLSMIARLALQRGGYYLTPEMQMERKDDYLEYYQIAKDYTKKLIDLKDRELPDDFRQIFMNQCKFIAPVNDEVLFEVPFAVGEGDVGWNIGIDVERGNHPYGSGGNYMAMPPTYVYSFDVKDERFDVTCGFYKINEDFQQELVSSSAFNISQGKWSRHFMDTPPGPSTDKGTGINWPMMRYADVLLMYAEAENELNGPTDSAIEAFRRVRQRAFDAADWADKVDAYIANATASKERFFNAIVDERAWEFGGEMIRKYELIRWNLYHEKVQETVEGTKQMADNAQAGTGQYPDYLYTKINESGELDIYNKFEKVLGAPDDTWERQSWLISLVDEETGTYQEWITRDWENYTYPVRYIFPIPTTGIDNSKGLLKNDGYGF
ncbi:MAG: RagB/SusD family nutrient uptake outer membrane protein [Prolixibacteraceae bacterium]|jgi:hypothetical protein|nr:RagB/SusD family nutrient uptake outer membrane protein [Prolixibacteraceae bacterium]